MMSLAIFLSSCNDELISNLSQCSPILSYIEIEGRQYIDIEKSTCKCRTYHFGKDYVGMKNNTKVWNEPLSNCNKLMGWKTLKAENQTNSDYAEVTKFWEDVRVQINNN
jgi:hypothetical protein